MILLLALTGCQTSPPQNNAIEVPEFSVPAPTRPTLEAVPSDVQGAIKALTSNLSKLVKHIEAWEFYDQMKNMYYESIIKLLI